MTEQERDRYKEEGLYEKLVALQTACDCMEGLRKSYEIFDGLDDGEEGDEDEDESDDSVVEVPPPPRTRGFSVGELS
jgi:hypothetical protein